jgi:hypothetical protein
MTANEARNIAFQTLVDDDHYVDDICRVFMDSERGGAWVQMWTYIAPDIEENDNAK